MRVGGREGSLHVRTINPASRRPVGRPRTAGQQHPRSCTRQLRSCRPPMNDHDAVCHGRARRVHGSTVAATASRTLVVSYSARNRLFRFVVDFSYYNESVTNPQQIELMEFEPSSVLAKGVAGKIVAEMTYFVSNLT